MYRNDQVKAQDWGSVDYSLWLAFAEETTNLWRHVKHRAFGQRRRLFENGVQNHPPHHVPGSAGVSVGICVSLQDTPHHLPQLHRRAATTVVYACGHAHRSCWMNCDQRWVSCKIKRLERDIIRLQRVTSSQSQVHKIALEGILKYVVESPGAVCTHSHTQINMKMFVR